MSEVFRFVIEIEAPSADDAGAALEERLGGDDVATEVDHLIVGWEREDISL